MGSPGLEQMITFLLDTPMFGDLDAGELSQIVRVMQVQQIAAGEAVFTEGESGDAWYVVFDGEVEVLKRDASGIPREVTILGPRACFGEMAILDGSPRSATVRATRASVAFRFPRADFERLLAAGTLAAYKLIHEIALVLVRRQRRTTRRMVELLAEDDMERMHDALVPLIEQSAVAE